MHATLEQLLTLRDAAAAEEDLAVHVRECRECSDALESVHTIKERLRELPSRSTPPDRWVAIRTALLAATAERSVAVTRRPGWLLPAASAAAVLIAVVLTWSSNHQTRNADERVAATPGANETIHAAPAIRISQPALLAESQRLEAVLAMMPANTSLTRAGTALTVADLEDRIRWVDYRLNVANEAGISPRQANLLWRERVDLLNSLVAVRYADARTRAF